MDIPTVLVSAAVGAITSAITAYFTSKLKLSEERQKWSRDFALKYAETSQTSPAVAASLAKQFAIALLIVDETQHALSGTVREKVFVPPNSRLVVGRSPSCNIVIDDKLVSQTHGAFYTDNVHIFVEPMGAHNGIVVNSKLVENTVRVLLRNGDVVKMGETRFDVLLLS